MTKYEVDLRDRCTGNSIGTVLKTDDYDEAWDCVICYNKSNIKGYIEDVSIDDYIDGSDGYVADCYYVEED